MEDLHQKYSNLFKENEDLKIRIKYLEMRLEQNEKENGRCINCNELSLPCNESRKSKHETTFEHQNKEYENNKSENADHMNNECDQKDEEIKSLKNEMEKYKALVYKLIEEQKIITKSLGVILGYEYTLSETNRKIILRSIYSFDADDYIIFTFESGGCNLIKNHFTESYSNDIDQLIVKGKSVPAFLAHVTLDLFGKKTFQ